MKIFEDNILLTNVISVLISFYLVFEGISSWNVTPENLWKYPTDGGFIYNFQNLITGFFALLAATAIWFNTFYQESIKAKKSRKLMTWYMASQLSFWTMNYKRVKNNLNTKETLEIACKEFGLFEIPEFFLINLEYLSDNQQRRCFAFLDVISSFKNDADYLPKYDLLIAKNEIFKRLANLINNIAGYLTEEGIDPENHAVKEFRYDVLAKTSP